METPQEKPIETPVRFVTPAKTAVIVLRAERTLKSDGIIVKPLRIHFTDHKFVTSDIELIKMIRACDQYGKYVYELETPADTRNRIVEQKINELKSLGVDVNLTPVVPTKEPIKIGGGRDDEVPNVAVAKEYVHEDGTKFTNPLALYRYRVSKGEVTPKPRAKKKK